ncbi:MULTISPECIES: HNH endonuclease signature motif containing protein [Actinomycetes]|uniref:HNH endonuclease n=1 Tax=Actinomycetes TaxID=1760 RepID=UPI003415A9B5
MATSRTGTAEWKNVRATVLKEARGAGQATCPLCSTWLNWNQSKQPNSPEPDHIIPWEQGGTNRPSNLRVICRLCNGKRGGKQGRAKQLQAKREANTKPIDANTSFEW